MSSPRRLAMVSTVAAVLLTAALAGCGGNRVQDLYFSLEPDVVVVPSGRTAPGTLRVSPLTARGFIAGSRMVYRTREEPLEVKRYGQILWEEVPARAMADALTAALRASGSFEHVVSAGDPARADFLLTGQLLSFEHRPTDAPPAVVAELHLTLVRGKGREVLVDGTYVGTEPSRIGADGRTTPAAIVDAFNRLSGRLIGEVLTDARRLVPRL
jgi:cholesterol transport system auxiliary component